MHEGHRERLISKLNSANTSLSDHEILEILLFYAIPRKNVNELAHRLLDSFGSLQEVFNQPYDSLISIEGIGHKTATFFITLGEIMQRVDKNDKKPQVIFSYDGCKQLLIDSFRGATEEKFVAFFLDKKGQIIFRKIFCSHSENMVNFNLSELLKGVLAKKPHSVVVCHNHLSHSPRPSYADDVATGKIYLSLKLNGIILHDHIIVADNQTFSYHASDRMIDIIRNLGTITF